MYKSVSTLKEAAHKNRKYKELKREQKHLLSQNNKGELKLIMFLPPSGICPAVGFLSSHTGLSSYGGRLS